MLKRRGGEGCDTPGLKPNRYALATVAFLLFLLMSQSQCLGEALDSGVLGVVPAYAIDLANVEREVDSAKVELDETNDPDQSRQLRAFIDWKKSDIKAAKSQCVQAFYPESELPVAYSSRGDTAEVRPPPRSGRYDPVRLRQCLDQRFLRNFSNPAGSVACDPEGDFRLPLRPGRYAVFVGWPSVIGSFGASGWWQFVQVKAHEWKRLAPPRRSSIYQDCADDSACEDGQECRSDYAMSKKTCHLRELSAPPQYDSGVLGTVGGRTCGDTEPQCVEAFLDPGNRMAACGVCASRDGSFRLPLAPGHYLLQFSGPNNDGENLSLEVRPGQWKHVQIMAPEPGKPVPPCLPHS